MRYCLVFFFFLPNWALAQTVDFDCPMPSPLLEIQKHSEALGEPLCDGGEELGCSRYTVYESVKNQMWNKRGNKSCARGIYHYYCQNSLWKNLTLEQRFKQVYAYSKKYGPQLGFPSEVFPCIAAIETTNLEPIYVHMGNCKGEDRSASGLGQFILKAVLDDGLGLPPSAAKRLLKGSRIWSFHDQDHASLNASELAKMEKWAFKSKIFPFNTKVFTNYPLRFFHALTENPELQIEFLVHLMARKSQYSKVLSQLRGEARLGKVIEIYNGGKNAAHYSRAVMSCHACLKKDPHGDPLACLALAHPDIANSSRSGCPWNARH